MLSHLKISLQMKWTQFRWDLWVDSRIQNYYRRSINEDAKLYFFRNVDPMKYTTMPVCSITYEAVAFISMLAALSTLVERNNYFKPRAIINQPAFPEDTPLPLSVCPTPTRPDGNIYSQLLNSGKASRKQILPNVGGWGGRFPNKVQSKPLKTPPNHSQNRPFLPNIWKN